MSATLRAIPGPRTRAAREVTGVVGDLTARRWDADTAVTELYAAHYRSLVRLSALLLRDTGAAEETVQDAFVALHGRWWRLRDQDRALAYLRQTVVNRSRSVLRHRTVVLRHPEAPPPPVGSAEDTVMGLAAREELLAVLDTLPRRQREVLVLRYYSDFSEAEIARTLGISAGAVKSHASRGMTALRTALEGTR